MTGEAVVWRLLLSMAADAEAHVQIDVPLRDRLVRDVAVAGRALDVGADVRRVVEADVRLLRIAVDPLPLEIEAFVLKSGDLLDARLVGGNRRMAAHAGIHARQPGPRAARNAFMTALGAADALLEMDVVREFDRLARRRLDPEVIARGLVERVACLREERRRLLRRGGPRRRRDRRGTVVEPSAGGAGNPGDETPDEGGNAQDEMGPRDAHAASVTG